MIVYYVSGALALIFAAVATMVGADQRDPSAPARSESSVIRKDWRPRPRTAPGTVWIALSGLTLILVGALRWRVGTDYPNYAHAYPTWAGEPLSSYGLFDEPGLAVIAKVGALIYDDYSMMLGLASVATLGLFIHTIHRSSNAFAFSLALFMLTGPWLGSFNGVRQYLACAVIFAGHRFIVDRKPLHYAGIVFLATLFHVSAMVTILFYLLPRRRLTALSGGIVVISALIVGESYGRILDVVVAFRPDNDLTVAYVTEQINPLRVAVAFAPLVLYAVVTDKQKLKPNDHFLVHLLLVNAAAFMASFGSAYIARFTAYSLIFVCIAVPRLINGDTSRQFRVLLMVAIVALYFVYWYVETTAIYELAHFRWVFNRDPEWVP